MATYKTLQQQNTTEQVDDSVYNVSDELYRAAVDDYNRRLQAEIAKRPGLYAAAGGDPNTFIDLLGANSTRDTLRQLQANIATQKAAYESNLAKANARKEANANANRTVSDTTKELKNLQFAGDSHTNEMNKLAIAKDDYYNYVNATQGELNQLQYDKGQYVGAKKEMIEDRIAEIQKERNRLFTAYDNAANSSNSIGLSNQETLADQALRGEAISNQATAIANKKGNISAGIDKGKAGLLGSQEANKVTAGEATNNYATNASNQANSQADWLKAQGAVDAAKNRATVAGKAVPNASMAGLLQGLGSGAALGAAL